MIIPIRRRGRPGDAAPRPKELAVDGPETNPWRRAWRPLVIAHRGQSAEVPENTLSSFTRAVELGAEIVEGDVQRSRDGRLVMMHGTLEQSTNGNGVAGDFSWDELQGLDAGGWLGPAFAGLRIPSLEAVLDLAGDLGVQVCIDVKGATPDEAAATAVAVAELVRGRGRGATERMLLNSFHYAAFEAARHVLPDLEAIPDITAETSEDPGATVALARSLGARITMHHADMPGSTVAALHDAGIAVWVWSATGEAKLARSISDGVDGILGQDVGAVLDVVDRLRPGVGPSGPAT
jgi:glycerophosphoryl diester phosphodiesterase